MAKAQMIQLAGRTYLTGRRLHPAFLGFLVVRDIILSPFLGVTRRNPDLATARNIAVCKPDHLGDLLMVVPALKLLRTLAPKASLTLVIGEWTESLALFLKAGGVVDDVVVSNFALMDRSKRSLVAKLGRERETRAAALKVLRGKNLDVFFDMRPFSPNAWSLALASRAQFRIGFGLRGMAFTYHRLMDFDAEKPVGQMFLDAVGGLGSVSASYSRPELPSSRGLAARVLPTEITKPYVVVQLYSAEDKRNIPAAVWKRVIENLQREFVVVLVGSSREEQRADEDSLHISGAIFLFGQTTIPELLRLVEESSGVIGVDSFVAHIGLAYEKPVAVLTVEGFSDKKSYPVKNSMLGFFSCEEIESDEVVKFISERSLELDDGSRL